MILAGPTTIVHIPDGDFLSVDLLDNDEGTAIVVMRQGCPTQLKIAQYGDHLRAARALRLACECYAEFGLLRFEASL